MSFDHLPEISGRLLVLPFDDRLGSGFGLMRTDTSPAVEVAIVDDGPLAASARRSNTLCSSVCRR